MDMNSLLSFVRARRSVLVLMLDASAAGAAFFCALYVRLGMKVWEYAHAYLWEGIAVNMLVALAVFAAFRIYRRSWRYYSIRDVISLLRAAFILLVISYAALFLFTRLEGLPRLVPVTHALILVAFLCGPRFLRRMLFEQAGESQRRKVPIILLGLNDASEMFIREAARNVNFPYHPVALITAQKEAVGQSIHHVRVYGGYEELGRVVDKLTRKEMRPEKLIICHQSLSGEWVKEMLAFADKEGIPLARLPNLTEFSSGEVGEGSDAAMRVKPVDVEDLLGRPQTRLDKQAMHRLIVGKDILVTGAGGSIGSELVRQISTFQPARVILLDHAEHNLYQIDSELHGRFADVQHVPVLCDVRDKAHVDAVWRQYRPEIVFHAAAIKHVPLSEMNAEEAVLTNVLGTRHIAEACIAHDTKMMLMISTDKAVNPANVMGASKRVAEMVCNHYARQQNSTEFAAVRFGNVLGSAGSVVPMFQKQLDAGGPMTVTHPEITRYFMTIREAVELVIQSAALGHKRGGEVAQVTRKDESSLFVLDMGEPVKIIDLAEQMVRLAGLVPHKDISFKFTGLRPGEKMYEELFYEDETLQDTPHASIKCAANRAFDDAEFLRHVETLLSAAHTRDAQATRDALEAMLPDYQTIIPEK